jgi:cell division protein FtsB
MAEKRPRGRRTGGIGFKLFLILLLVVLVGLAYLFIGGKYGYLRIRTLEQERLRIARETAVLKLEREALLQEKRLAQEKDSLLFERKAREDLGMVKEHERVIRFPHKARQPP